MSKKSKHKSGKRKYRRILRKKQINFHTLADRNGIQRTEIYNGIDTLACQT